MTDFLVRRFVRDSENTESTEVRTRYGILASVVGIFCNVFLFAAKLIIGTLMHSLAVTADAFNNLSDAASSIISFIGVKMAGKPADAEHPFGHGRIEYIAALIVSFLVIEVGFTFFKTSAGKLMHPEDITFDLVPFLILMIMVFPLTRLIIGTVVGKLDDAGYTRTEDKDAASVGIQLSYVEKVNYFVGYDYPYWWWYYPYYWAPGYWGDWLGWHYPYQVYYGYTAGSMLIEMVDLTADRQSNRKLPVIWDSFIGGLLTSSHKVNMQRTLDAVNQAFMQSPYLETNSVNR